MNMSEFVKDVPKDKYTHQTRKCGSKTYITLTLRNGLVLDFSLGGVFHGRYCESKLKRATYMNNSAYIRDAVVVGGFICIDEMNLALEI